MIFVLNLVWFGLIFKRQDKDSNTIGPNDFQKSEHKWTKWNLNEMNKNKIEKKNT